MSYNLLSAPKCNLTRIGRSRMLKFRFRSQTQPHRTPRPFWRDSDAPLLYDRTCSLSASMWSTRSFDRHLLVSTPSFRPDGQFPGCEKFHVFTSVSVTTRKSTAPRNVNTLLLQTALHKSEIKIQMRFWSPQIPANPMHEDAFSNRIADAWRVIEGNVLVVRRTFCVYIWSHVYEL